MSTITEIIGRPNTAPAYYQGRSASLWISVMRPQYRHTAPRDLVGFGASSR